MATSFVLLEKQALKLSVIIFYRKVNPFVPFIPQAKKTCGFYGTYINDQWEIVDPATVNDGGISSGTIISVNALDLAGEKFFTLASSEEEPLPTAGFVNASMVNCGEVPATLTVQLTGTEPWSLRIDDGTSVTDYAGIETSTGIFDFDVTPSETTTYTISGVRDATTGDYITETVYGDPVTITVVEFPPVYTVDSNSPVCSGEPIIIEVEDTFATYNYRLYENSGFTGLEQFSDGTIIFEPGAKSVGRGFLFFSYHVYNLFI